MVCDSRENYGNDGGGMTRLNGRVRFKVEAIVIRQLAAYHAGLVRSACEERLTDRRLVIRLGIRSKIQNSFFTS